LKSVDHYAPLAAVLNHYRSSRLLSKGDLQAAAVRPTRGFQTIKTAAATIKGFEVMRMIRRGQCLTCKPHVKDEIRFVNKLFDIFSIAA
jgi:transposase-like protein